MTTAILKYFHTRSKTQSKARLLNLPSLNWNIFCIVGFIIIAISLFFYVYNINELTKGAYLIKNYEKQTTVLLQKARGLEVDFAKSGFMGNLESKTKELSFEKTKKIKYIQIQSLDDPLAAAK